MALEEIEKYIFDPNNPKQCKSYNLLLNITKGKHRAFIDIDYIYFYCANLIINNDFLDKLWDKPDNFDSMRIGEKIDFFIKSLSEKEFEQHINSVNFNSENLIYNKIFKSFFKYGKLNGNNYIENIDKFDNNTLRDYFFINKLIGNYKRFAYEKIYEGHKVLFTNNIDILLKNNNFYDVSSVVITTKIELFQNKSSYYQINRHIKPIILKDIKDLSHLLNVLYNDLQQAKNKDEIPQNIEYIDSIKIENFYSIDSLEIKKRYI